MREILFRGKRLDTGEWVEGYLCRKYFQERPHDRCAIQYKTKPYGDEWKPDYMTAEIYPDTVGQYTGMNIYGKKIFEGDILKLDYIGEGRGVQGVAEVVFKYGKFCMPWGHRKELVPLDGFANTTMEIIGNIHDNPELLEGGE